MQASRFRAPGTHQLPVSDEVGDNEESKGSDSPNAGGPSGSLTPAPPVERGTAPLAPHGMPVSYPAGSAGVQHQRTPNGQYGKTTPQIGTQVMPYAVSQFDRGTAGPSAVSGYQRPVSADEAEQQCANDTQAALASSQYDKTVSQYDKTVSQYDKRASQYDKAATPQVYVSGAASQPASSHLPAESAAATSVGVISAAITPRPLRVIHVGELLVRAGIEVWLKGLIRHANPERLRFTRCVVTSNRVDHHFAAEIGIPVEIGGPESARRAARDCDVMMISGPKELGSWLADAPPKVCISVAHGESRFTREIIEGCAPLLDHVVAVSPRVQQHVCGGFHSSVIYNGVDAAHVASSRPRQGVRESLGFGPDDFVIGYVGRFSEEKRLEAILEAAAGLPARFKVLLVGWGPLYHPLLDLANQLIPMRYAFVEAKQHVGDYYNAMDAFCLVSESEGYGLVTMEAMMCERPVVVTPVGFVPEAIEDRVNGVIVDGAPDSIREAMLLLQRYSDWARSIAREGRKFAEDHGRAFQMAREYEELFEQLWRQKFAA